MIVAWNVRGLNKRARHVGIGSHIRNMQVSYVAMLEIRVKLNNVNKVRKVFGSNWTWLDNYDHHPKIRIWIPWKNKDIYAMMNGSSYQLIHCEMLNNTWHIQYWLTVVYAHDQLSNMREL